MPNPYKLRLFGAFSLTAPDGTDIAIRGAKHRALLALLATAARGTHTRGWLQDTLWHLSGEELGRASLRRALSDLRRILGEGFDHLVQTSNADVTINKELLVLVGSQADGEFLEGLRIREPRFATWLEEKRLGLTGLGRPAHGLAKDAMLPRIAVVPFTVVSGGSQDQFFSDMVCLEVTRTLSRSNMVNVISHLSSRQFAKPFLDMNEVRDGLKIQYLVHGTIRIDGNRFRVDSDTIQAETGIIENTRSYSGDVRSFLAGDQEIISDIGRDIGQSILSASIELANSAPLSSVSNHALLLSSIGLMHRHQLSDFSLARAQLEELIARDPSYSELHGWLAKWYILSISQGWSVNPKLDLQIAQDTTARALDLNPVCPLSLTIDGMVQGDRNSDHDLAEVRFRRAVAIDPNNALAWLMYSRLESFRGEGSTAVAYSGRAHDLSPFDPYGYFFDILRAMAHNVAGNYEDGRRLAKRSVAANPHHTSSFRVLAISEQMLGHSEDAQATVARLRQLDPAMTIESYRANHPASMQEIGQQWAEALRRAGVPER